MGEGVKINFFWEVKNLGVISYKKHLIFDRCRRKRKKAFWKGGEGDK